MLTCPSCEKALEFDTVAAGHDTCPHCGSELIPAHLRGAIGISSEVLDTNAMKPFEYVDPALYERIQEVVPTLSWQFGVMAEIVDFQFGRLSQFLNNSPQVRNAFIEFGSEKRKMAKIRAVFEEFVSALSGIQEVFASKMWIAAKTSDMTDLLGFHEQLQLGVDKIMEFYSTTAKMRFRRDSRLHQIQGIMLDWVQYLLVQFERLAKQMRRKTGLDQTRINDLFVQITIAPYTLPKFFNLVMEADN